MIRPESSVSSTSRTSDVDDDEPINVESIPSCIPMSVTEGYHLDQASLGSTHVGSEFSPTTALMAMSQSRSYLEYPPRAAMSAPPSSPPTPYSLRLHPSLHVARPSSASQIQTSSTQPYVDVYISRQGSADLPASSPAIPEWTGNKLPNDPYKHLRNHNIGTKTAWKVIPASEGFRILDLCKSMSTAASAAAGTLPCYNRETLFDEEWQAHMKDVHGVFLIWPETWVRRIEVLDLDEFEGDIVAVNDVVMDS